MDGGYDEDTLSSLANIAKSQEVNQIVIESNFGDGMFLKLLDPVLQKIYPCSTDEIRSNVQKEKRIIDTLEPVMNSHRLVVDQDLIYDDFKLDKQHQLFHQMTRLTRTKGCLRHDDLIDVLGMAVNYWTTTIGRNVDDAEQEAKEERLNQELDRFMEHSIGRSNYSNNSFID
jgi:hypothetical protein